MENWILKAKHWQIFLLFAISYCLSNYSVEDALLNGCIFLGLLVVYVGWYALLGNTLYQYLQRGRHYNPTWFLLDAFLVIATYAASLIFFNGNLQISGWAAISGLYIFFAIFHLFWFPAVLLVDIESKAEPTFSQYAGTMLQLFFWPLGIWFIQPRLNKIYNAIQADTLDYPRP